MRLADNGTVYALQEVSSRAPETNMTRWTTEYTQELTGFGTCQQFDSIYSPWSFPNGYAEDPARSAGNAVISSVDWDYRATMDLYAPSGACVESTPNGAPTNYRRRNASVARLDEGDVRAWVMSVHLATEANPIARLCQLQKLWVEIDAIDPSIAIVVAGDFNINTNTAGTHYQQMIDGFGARGFFASCRVEQRSRLRS